MSTPSIPWTGSVHRTLSRSIHRYGGSVPPVPPGPSTRYLSMLDGQSKFWRREVPWVCVDPIVEIVYLGKTSNSTYFCFDGADNTDRAYAYVNATTGFVNSIAGASILLNGNSIGSNAVRGEEGKLNRLRVSFSGSFRVQALGCRFSLDSLFSPIPFFSVDLVDPSSEANSFSYPLDSQDPYSMPNGLEPIMPLPSEAFVFQNSSVDKSDRQLITKNEDTPGYTGTETWEESLKTVTGSAAVTAPDAISIDEVGSSLAAIGISVLTGYYRVSGNANLISGKVDLSVKPAFAGVKESITASGDFSFDVLSEGLIGFKRSFDQGAQVVISQLKVVPIYDWAEGANPNAT